MKGKKENEVALRQEFMPQAALAQIESLAEKLKDSKALPSTITNGAQLMMVMMAGYEAGMTPIESINSYYIINGKITIWGRAVLSQAKRAGIKVKWLESTEKVATVMLTDTSGETHTETYTIEDATKALLLSKDNWKKYPKDMLRWKVLGRGVNFFCPEVIGRHYIKEDIEDGEFAEASVVQTHKPTISVDAIATAHVEKDEESEPGLSEEGHRAISDAWLELAKLEGWSAHDMDIRLGKTLKKYYGKERGSDLTEDEAKDFVRRLNETLKKNIDAAQAVVDENQATPAEVVSGLGGKLPVACPLCKVEFTDFDAEMGNVKAVENIGMCNPCSIK